MSNLKFKVDLPVNLKASQVAPRQLESSRPRKQLYVLWTLAGILFIVHTAYTIYNALGWKPENHRADITDDPIGFEVGQVKWEPCTQLKGVDCGYIVYVQCSTRSQYSIHV